jgi:hypothetical protein
LRTFAAFRNETATRRLLTFGDGDKNRTVARRRRGVFWLYYERCRDNNMLRLGPAVERRLGHSLNDVVIYVHIETYGWPVRPRSFNNYHSLYLPQQASNHSSSFVSWQWHMSQHRTTRGAVRRYIYFLHECTIIICPAHTARTQNGGRYGVECARA